MGYLLDTNIITAILKKNSRVLQKFLEVLDRREEVFINCLSYYEIKRGLLAVNANRQISDFNDLCKVIKILLLDDMGIIEKASEIHADLKSRGRPIQDVDILIAATAMTKGLILVSNDSDMLQVQGITVENWLARET